MKRTKSIPKMLLSVRRLFNIIITHELWNAIEDYIVFGNRLNYLTYQENIVKNTTSLRVYCFKVTKPSNKRSAMNCATTNADTLKIRDSDSNCAHKALL